MKRLADGGRLLTKTENLLVCLFCWLNDGAGCLCACAVRRRADRGG